MANDIIPPNTPFTRAAAQVRAKRRAEGVDEAEAPRKASPRAKLNFFPDDSMLAEMVDRALSAMSRGITWARGAIVNLVV